MQAGHAVSASWNASSKGRNELIVEEDARVADEQFGVLEMRAVVGVRTSGDPETAVGEAYPATLYVLGGGGVVVLGGAVSCVN
jgi:hypothetical protein